MSPEERERLIIDNMPLARFIAASFARTCPSIEAEEWEGYAFEYLTAATLDFDPRRGLTFGQWAALKMRSKMRHRVAEQGKRWARESPVDEVYIETASNTEAVIEAMRLEERLTDDERVIVAQFVAGAARPRGWQRVLTRLRKLAEHE